MNITLPWPPSVNSYFTEFVGNSKVPGKKRVFKGVSKNGQEYRKAVAQHVLMHRAENGYHTHSGRLRMEIKAFPPDRRARDLDNLLKSLLDALTHANVWADDYQVRDLRIYDAGQIIKGGQIVVSIEGF